MTGALCVRGMKTLLTLAALLAAMLCGAQDCKYTEDEVDEFTKARRVSTEARIALNMSVGMFFKYRYVGGEYILQCHWSTTSIDVIGADESLYIKLSNDSIIELRSMSVQAPERSQYYKWVDMPYAATRDQFNLMATHAVVKVRI